jgi:transcriptional regulator with XRE-family HTH domain
MQKKYTDIGARLRKLRGKRTQAAFAQEIGTTLRSYQHYESGARVPHIHLLSKIADICDTTSDWILTGKASVRGKLRGEYAQLQEKGLDLDFLYLYLSLERIYLEGDPVKIDAIKSQLRALDPGEAE